MLRNKQNVFDDFIACAEGLVAEKITSSPKLAISTTADQYDRVVPAHSFKLAAALQAAQAGEAPVLIRIQTKAGHGFGKPTAILIEEFTDSYAFLIWALGVEH